MLQYFLLPYGLQPRAITNSVESLTEAQPLVPSFEERGHCCQWKLCTVSRAAGIESTCFDHLTNMFSRAPADMHMAINLKEAVYFQST